jgi:two-component system chemotaxis response regulator CheB
LPPGFPLPVIVTLHRHRDADELLVPVVQRGCPLAVSEVEDKEPVRGNHVYLAPADYHLLLERDAFALSTDEPVNFARPSIDALFESAAEWGGRQVTAVVLSGSGSDGSRGARRVEVAGGQVLIQDPAGAVAPWMPAAAVAATSRRQVLSLPAIADALLRLGAAAGF